MKKTDYILKLGKNYVCDYKEPEFSELPWTLSLVSNAVYANRYEDLSEAEKIQHKVGGEIYQVTTTAEKFEEAD